MNVSRIFPSQLKCAFEILERPILKHTWSLYERASTIFARRLPSNSRIAYCKIDVGRAISKITRCGAAADVERGHGIAPSMPLQGWITNPASCEWRYHGAFGAFDASGRFVPRCLSVQNSQVTAFDIPYCGTLLLTNRYNLLSCYLHLPLL